MRSVESGRVKQILVLEDDELFAGSFAQSLSSRIAANVMMANDPAKALRMVDSLKIDLLVADMHLGARNSMTLLNEMASYPDTLELPKIILSSSGDNLSLDDLRRYGVSAVYDKKTYNFDDLVTKVRELLGDGS